MNYIYILQSKKYHKYLVKSSIYVRMAFKNNIKIMMEKMFENDKLLLNASKILSNNKKEINIYVGVSLKFLCVCVR